MYLKSIFAAITAVTFSVGATSAATIDAQYSATSAEGSGAEHSVWISKGVGNSIGQDFNFDPAGLFTMYSDGVATLTGRVVSQKKKTAWFDLSFNYDNDFSGTMVPTFKSENGSVENGAIYRDLKGGTLIGGGVLAGLNLSVTRMPADGKFAAQIGEGTDTNNGANNKNKNFGMANWFFITVDSYKDCTRRFCKNGRIFSRLDGTQGDVNIDLSPVPVPAAGLLMIGALGSLGLLRRRKQRKAA